MIKGIQFFILVWTFVAFGIWAFFQLSGRDKWSVFKIALYGAITATIATIVVVAMVFIF